MARKGADDLRGELADAIQKSLANVVGAIVLAQRYGYDVAIVVSGEGPEHSARRVPKGKGKRK